jgi:hypothetical protein
MTTYAILDFETTGMTPAEMNRRFEQIVDQAIWCKDPAKVRSVME